MTGLKFEHFFRAAHPMLQTQVFRVVKCKSNFIRILNSMEIRLDRYPGYPVTTQVTSSRYIGIGLWYMQSAATDGNIRLRKMVRKNLQHYAK